MLPAPNLAGVEGFCYYKAMNIHITFKRVVIAVVLVGLSYAGYVLYRHEVAQTQALATIYDYLEKGVKTGLLPQPADIAAKLKAPPAQ